MAKIDASVLVELIGCIYDCVVSPTLWEPTVDRIQREFDWHNAVLASTSLVVGSNANIQVLRGVSEPYASVASSPDYVVPVLEMWGGAKKVAQAPLEEPILASVMGNPKTWPENRYFIDFVEPQNIIDAVAIGLARDSTMIATLSGGRHRSAGPFREEELAALRVLAPHLRRAVTISNLFDDLQARNKTFIELLDRSRAAIFLVDDNLSILHANRRAEKMLSEQDPVGSIAGRLTFSSSFPSESIARLVQPFNADKLVQRGAGISIYRKDGTRILVQVLPLTGGEIRREVSLRATNAIFVAPAPTHQDLASEALSDMFDLTPAECRVMQLVAGGLSVRDAAHRLGIAPSTCKTHLLRVYEKTGVHRQAELASLARELTGIW